MKLCSTAECRETEQTSGLSLSVCSSWHLKKIINIVKFHYKDHSKLRLPFSLTIKVIWWLGRILILEEDPMYLYRCYTCTCRHLVRTTNLTRHLDISLMWKICRSRGILTHSGERQVIWRQRVTTWLWFCTKNLNVQKQLRKV